MAERAPAKTKLSRKRPGVPYAGFDWTSALQHLQPHLTPPLVLPQQEEAIRVFARGVPALWHWGMFELRLAEPTSAVDVLGALLQQADTRTAILDSLDTSAHPAVSQADATLRKWASHDGSPFSSTPNLWLEWDRDAADSPPLPWLCVAPHFFDARLNAPTPDQIGLLAEEFMSTDRRLHVSGASERLTQLTRALPPGGQMMGFASLRPRGKSVCRAFARLPRGGTKEWLEKISWPGDPERFREIRPLFAVPEEYEWCQIEFDEQVGTHLALELGQTERGFARRASRARWLDEVVARGWASREKADAVLNWHGETACTLCAQQESETRTCDRTPVRLLRSFHLKLTIRDHSSSPQAKAYLGFYFRKKRSAQEATH